MTTHEDRVAALEAPPATADRRPLALTLLTPQCGGGHCPAVYGTEHETVVVQGYVVNGADAGIEVPDGERVVEIPVDILLAAADKIRNQA